jgi:GNAT superfamily N-acetyltransferase
VKLELNAAYRISHQDLAVGHMLVVLQRDFTPTQLYNLWDGAEHFTKWTLPDTFDYLWIHEMWIHNEYRRQGYGARAFRRLMRTRRKPTLFALGPGDIDTVHPLGYAAVVDFYTSLGFYFQVFNNRKYGFHWSPGEQS